MTSNNIIYTSEYDGVVYRATRNGQRLDAPATTSSWTGFQVLSRTIVVVRFVLLVVPYEAPINVISSFAIDVYPIKMAGQLYANGERPYLSVCKSRDLYTICKIQCTNGYTFVLDE